MTEEIKIKKGIITTAVIAILAILLVISIFTGGFGTNSSPSANVVKDEPTQAPTVNMKSLIDDDAIKGDPNALVTIVEFSDYECPFCARFYSETFLQIQSEYIDTGKVNFIFRDFPLSFHKQAQKAAEAAECAGEQGMYFDMHDKLFKEGVVGGVTAFKQYAKDIGLNTNEFNTCLDSNAMKSEVQKDFADGQKAGVKGTPAFFINGEFLSGAQPFSVFKQKIDSLLPA